MEEIQRGLDGAVTGLLRDRFGIIPHGVSDIFCPGDAALYFAPHDADDMAASIDRLLTDTDVCRELSQKALARAKNYSWDRTAKRTLDILYQAAGKPK